MNGTQSGKTFIFLWGIVVVSMLAVIRFWLGLRNGKKNLSALDLLFFIYIMYLLYRNNWRELSHSLLFLELIGLAILYIIVRQQSTQSHLWILIALSIGGLIQALYGNLQLWGYFPSNHGLFKMTGSFFNPGPYSGYLSAIFPISVGLYLFNISISIPKPNSIFLTRSFYFNQSTTSFIKKIFPFNFFYNRNMEKFSPEEQESRTKLADYFTMKSFYLISMISICLVLPASRSRASWLAVAVSSLYLVSVKFQFFQHVKVYLNTRIKKLCLLALIVILPALIGVGLYHLKKGSADGRLLIWNISTEMIKDRPVFGYGYDGFKEHYMDFQADYFKDNSDSKQALVAGDTNYAFNELIQLTVENGIVGILPLFSIIFLVFFQKFKAPDTKKSEKKYVYCNVRLSFPLDQISINQTNYQQHLLLIARAVILSILVFGLFSYPLQILPIKICLVVALAIAAKNLSKKKIARLHLPVNLNRPFQFALRSIISVGCLGLIWLAVINIKLVKAASINWKNAFDLYNYGIYDDCLNDYKKAYPVLKTNGDFLTNYGKALSMAENHDEAVIILQQAAKYYPNVVIYTALGDSYKELGKAENAELSYLHAWYMNPSRFYPKYLLAKLYDQTGQKGKAIEVAKELLGKDVKIESTAIQEIKDEMKNIIK